MASERAGMTDQEKRLTMIWWITTVGATVTGFMFAVSPQATSLLGVLAFSVVFPLTITTATRHAHDQ